MTENCDLRIKLLKLFSNKNISPFKNNIKKISLSNIEIPNNINKNFYEENFSSNFISNFSNPIHRNIFVNSIKSNLKKNNNQNNKNFYLKNIQNILTENLCLKEKEKNKNKNNENKNKNNKNNENKIENPNCLFCLKDIKLKEKIYFLNCGHIFHLNCFDNYLNEFNNFFCPFCKYNFIDDIIKEEENDDIIIKDISYKDNNINNKINNIFEERINLFF
jgi:uncharacterized Zn ribbon protein